MYLVDYKNKNKKINLDNLSTTIENINSITIEITDLVPNERCEMTKDIMKRNYPDEIKSLAEILKPFIDDYKYIKIIPDTDLSKLIIYEIIKNNEIRELDNKELSLYNGAVYYHNEIDKLIAISKNHHDLFWNYLGYIGSSNEQNCGIEEFQWGMNSYYIADCIINMKKDLIDEVTKDDKKIIVLDNNVLKFDDSKTRKRK